MRTRNWYAGIALLALALIAHAFFANSTARYRCQTMSGSEATVVCVDGRTGNAEIVGPNQGRLVSIRWQIGGTMPPIRHSMPVADSK